MSVTTQPSISPFASILPLVSDLSEPLSRAEQVALVLLRKIAEGRYQPGERLPRQEDLRMEMMPQMSMTDFNGGLKILEKEGFLRIKQSRHTAIESPLPFSHHYGLALPSEKSHVADTSLFSVMARMAKELSEQDGKLKVHTYYTEPASPDNGRSLEDLKQAVRWHRVAGVLFTHQFYNSENLYEEPGISRVFNAENLATRNPHMFTAPHFLLAEPDGESFMRLALKRIAEMGCRTVAVIDPSTGQEPLLIPHLDMPKAKFLLGMLKEYGLETRPEWLLCIKAASWEIGRLLAAHPDRPDAILINDDGLVPALTAGIASTPQPWPVVAGVVNFPALPTTHVPTIFGGFDIRSLIHWCFQALRDPVLQAQKAHLQVRVLMEEEWHKAGNTAL